MITFNKEITQGQAKQLVNSKKGMSYPDTKHNRKAIAKEMDLLIKNLPRHN